MRHDKIKIFELRKEGKSYREIQSLIAVSRGTLCEWFRDERWSKHVKESNTKIQLKDGAERLMRMNKARQILINNKYEDIEKEARKEFELNKEKPLFMAGLMLYAGEGDKLSKGSLRFANTDFFLHKIFINFVNAFMKIDKKYIKFSVLLYPDLNVEECKNKWSSELDIPLSNFYKPQIIQGRHKTKRLHFGVGSIIICGSYIKYKLLLWVELAKDELIK